jgi:hypothetical protein
LPYRKPTSDFSALDDRCPMQKWQERALSEIELAEFAGFLHLVPEARALQ